MRSPRAPTLRAIASRATAHAAYLSEMQADILVLEETLVLLEDGVARFGKDLDQRGFVKLVGAAVPSRAGGRQTRE